ncbi:hypothetical protein GBF38_011988, partial [Nibea albiflora]
MKLFLYELQKIHLQGTREKVHEAEPDDVFTDTLLPSTSHDFHVRSSESKVEAKV